MMHEFLLGLIVMGCLASGLFFLRFWKRTRVPSAAIPATSGD